MTSYLLEDELTNVLGDSALTSCKRMNILRPSESLFLEDLMVMSTQQPGNQQFRENRGKIQGWLMGEGWRIGEERNPEAAWVLTATDVGGRILVVAQRNDKPDVVIIQGTVSIGDDVRHKLGQTLAERNQFYFDLQYALLEMGVEYLNIGEPFDRPTVLQRVYTDALTRDTFIQRAMVVRNAVVMILLKIAQLMNQPPEVMPDKPPISIS